VDSAPQPSPKESKSWPCHREREVVDSHLPASRACQLVRVSDVLDVVAEHEFHRVQVQAASRLPTDRAMFEVVEQVWNATFSPA
jgi:hypothetical protein